MAEDLDALLDSYQAGTLHGIAAAAGIDVAQKGRSPSKATMIARLRVELFSESRVQEAWRALDGQERQILNRLLLHGGEANTRGLKRELLRVGLVVPTPGRASRDSAYVSYAHGYIGHPKRERSRVFEDVMARLTQCGIVFSRAPRPSWSGNPYNLDFHPGVSVLVPEAVRRFLPKPEPIPPALAGWEPGRVEVGAPDLLLRDLYLYWDSTRRSEATLIRSGHVGKRWLRAINDVLLVPDTSLEAAGREDETARLFLLRQLLEGLGLVASEEGALRPAGDPLAIPSFWGLSPLEQRAACLRLWPQVLDHLEIGDRETSLPDVQGGKRALLIALAGVPVGVWLTPEELQDRAAGAHGGSLLYGRDDGLHSDLYGSDDGARIEKENEAELDFLVGCLRGFLLEIGLVELAYDEHQMRGFRLSRDAPALLSQAPTEPLAATQDPRSDVGASVIVQPNFQVLAIGPVSLDVLARLDLCAERQRADRAAFEYHLSRESVYGAQQLGMSAAEVGRFLREISVSELPQNVSRSLAEWGAHHERIVFRDGVSLVHAADAALLEKLAQDAQVRRLGLRALTPEVALLRRDHQGQFLSALLKQGLLPAVSTLGPESADNSVLVADDGTIRAVHAVPSLYLRDRLARFAEQTGERQWRLTPRSVGRGGGSKGKVLRLLDELTVLQRGDLPDGLAEKIKVWGGYYGTAAVETLTLIEFSDQETLDELLQRPELRGDLIPFGPGKGKRALAVIAEGRRAQVEKALERLGVRIRDAMSR